MLGESPFILFREGLSCCPDVDELLFRSAGRSVSDGHTGRYVALEGSSGWGWLGWLR